MLKSGNHGWRLEQLLEGIVELPYHLYGIEVTGLSMDSRTVSAGDLFFALAGGSLDGADFVEQALEHGAVALLWEHGELNVAVGIQTTELREKVGVIASRFYGNPSASLRVAAVTGTDGKSSVTHFIASAMEKIEGGAGVIGTVGARMSGEGGVEQSSSHTTPPPVELQRLLSQMVEHDGKSVALEASSHGIEQSRLAGCVVNTAVLTQLGRDHMDYHGSVERYGEVKKSLFYSAGLESTVVNMDDALGREIRRSSPQGVQAIGYGLDLEVTPAPELRGVVISQSREGMLLEVEYRGETVELRSLLYGRFNGSNLLAALGVLISWQVPLRQAVAALEMVEPVPGRMEPFGGVDGGGALLVVDYAHTSGALAAALTALRDHLHGTVDRGRLWVLFGCGGERDRGKRAEMGEVAEHHADLVVVTSDNPRSEPPGQIIQQILQGTERPGDITVIENREQAIRYCVREAEPTDTVLIAGKGHEEWQWVGGEKIPFSDRELANLLAEDSTDGG